MPISRSVLEQQLELAKSERDAAAAGLDSDRLKRDPQWRSADARYRQIVRRLRKVNEVEQLDAELRQRHEGTEE